MLPGIDLQTATRGIDLQLQRARNHFTGKTGQGDRIATV